MISVSVENLCKSYNYGLRFKDRVQEMFGFRKSSNEAFFALKNVNFQVTGGGVLGIIGENGSGKSTLLRLLAGITQPSSGKVRVNGRVGDILDLSAGFHPEFSGRDNIYMNCSILGIKKQEIDKKLDDILDFSELKDFINMPLRTYSSGMLARLGFSVATHIEPDVMLIDEVIAVGDQYFQRKCVEKIKELIKKRTTIVLASHNMHFVRSLCNEAIWLKEGVIVASGNTDKVVDSYIDFVRQKEGVYLTKLQDAGQRDISVIESRENGLWTVPQRQGSREAVIINVRLMDINKKEKSVFETGENMIVEVKFKCFKPLDSPIFGVAIHRNDGVYCYGPNTGFDNFFKGTFEGEGTYSIRYKELPLLSGSYSISVAIFDKEHVYPYDWHFCMYPFVVRTQLKDHGLTYIGHEWDIKKG